MLKEAVCASNKAFQSVDLLGRKDQRLRILRIGNVGGLSAHDPTFESSGKTLNLPSFLTGGSGENLFRDLLFTVPAGGFLLPF